jgi:hypothetical protein
MTKATGTAVAPRKSTIPANWEAQMKADAEKGRQREATVGVSRMLKTRGGILQYMDQPVPGNKLQAVVLAVGLENAFYEGDFDENNPRSPVCFAYAGGEPGEEAAMVPHADSPKKQHANCKDCPQNKFGTADKGRGKACKNQRVLVIMHADNLKKGRVEEAETVTAKVSPTGLPAFAAYVKQLANLSNKPSYAFVTEIGMVPDAKAQRKWTFQTAKEIARDLMPAVFGKAKAAEKELAERPPYQQSEDAPKQAKAKKKAKF